MVLQTTETANAFPLHTPPNPMMPDPADMYPYDVYGDPALYDISTQQSYYQPDLYAPHPHEYQTPSPAPYATTAMPTRSGRPLASPPSLENSQRAQSPKKKPPKKRSGKGKPRGPAIDQPLSVLTKDYAIPVRDMDAWVNRRSEDRHLEAEKKNGYISRPMNSFMLYRSAYAERVKQFCRENNHQVVSQVTGASWPLEPESVRREYERLAILERDNHARAFPDYKFAPNKNGKKRGRGDDNNDDSDGEWGGSSRTKRSRTARSSRYGGSRSNTGTPFDDGYYSTSYSPAPMHAQYNLSSYQQQYPGRITPTYPQNGYPEPMQHGISHYATNIEDVQYERYAALMMPLQDQSAVVGMPGIDSTALLATENESIRVGMVDPRLGAVRYETYGGYNAPSAETYHPGQSTLTEGRGQATHAGAAFDLEFENLRYH
ncbi:hypothetical protein DV736_g723, partial [Chaetothyriales sp. CBS 134916]